MTACADLTYEQISPGDQALFRVQVTARDVDDFARLSGDFNPLHMDEAYAATTSFGRRIVHGMLVGSFCSRLVGMHLPGKRCLYMTQSLDFLQPVFLGDEVEIVGMVQKKHDSTRTLTLAIEIRARDAVVARGKAMVRVLE